MINMFYTLQDGGGGLGGAVVLACGVLCADVTVVVTTLIKGQCALIVIYKRYF